MAGTVRTQVASRRMRAVVQRVSFARAMVGEEVAGEIGGGLLVLLAVHAGDGEDQAERMVHKLESLRIFEDGEGRMNRSVRDAGGEILVVSNFTLYGDTS